MRWPLVWRSRLDIALHNLERMREEASRERHDFAVRYDQSVQFLQDRNVELAKQNEALLEKYHALRLMGAQSPTLPKVERDVDPMVQLINQRTIGQSAQRALMLQQLKRDRAAGKGDAEIQKSIEAGESVLGVPA